MIVDSNVNMNSYKLTDLPNPTNNTDAATKNYVDSQLSQGGMPIGSIVIWATLQIPTGWLECNGQPVNQAIYPDLYKSMLTVPDLRGVFVRGYDNGKGYDTGRALRSYQADGLAAHTHDYFDYYWYDFYQEEDFMTPAGSQVGSRQQELRTTRVQSGGLTETRPKNIALFYIIKAK